MDKLGYNDIYASLSELQLSLRQCHVNRYFIGKLNKDERKILDFVVSTIFISSKFDTSKEERGVSPLFKIENKGQSSENQKVVNNKEEVELEKKPLQQKGTVLQKEQLQQKNNSTTTAGKKKKKYKKNKKNKQQNVEGSPPAPQPKENNENEKKSLEAQGGDLTEPEVSNDNTPEEIKRFYTSFPQFQGKSEEVAKLITELNQKVIDSPNRPSERISFLWLQTFGRDSLHVEKKLEQLVAATTFPEPKSLSQALQNLSHLESNLTLDKIDLLCSTVEYLRINFKNTDPIIQSHLLKRMGAIVKELSQTRTKDVTILEKIDYLNRFLGWMEKAFQIGLPLSNLPAIKESYSPLFRILYTDCCLADVMIYYGHKFDSVAQKSIENQFFQKIEEHYVFKKNVLYLENGFEERSQLGWEKLQPIRSKIPNPPQKPRVEVITSFPDMISAKEGHTYLRIHTTSGELYSVGLDPKETTLSSPYICEYAPVSKQITATYELKNEKDLEQFILEIEKKQQALKENSSIVENSASFVREIRDFMIVHLDAQRIQSKFTMGFLSRTVFRIQSLYLKIRNYFSETKSFGQSFGTVLPIDIAIETSSYRQSFWEFLTPSLRSIKLYMQSKKETPSKSKPQEEEKPIPSTNLPQNEPEADKKDANPPQNVSAVNQEKEKPIPPINPPQNEPEADKKDEKLPPSNPPQNVSPINKKQEKPIPSINPAQNVSLINKKQEKPIPPSNPPQNVSPINKKQEKPIPPSNPPQNVSTVNQEKEKPIPPARPSKNVPVVNKKDEKSIPPSNPTSPTNMESLSSNNGIPPAPKVPDFLLAPIQDVSSQETVLKPKPRTQSSGPGFKYDKESAEKTKKIENYLGRPIQSLKIDRSLDKNISLKELIKSNVDKLINEQGCSVEGKGTETKIIELKVKTSPKEISPEIKGSMGKRRGATAYSVMLPEDEVQEWKKQLREWEEEEDKKKNHTPPNINNSKQKAAANTNDSKENSPSQETTVSFKQVLMNKIANLPTYIHDLSDSESDEDWK